LTLIYKVSLADQLLVEPNPRVRVDKKSRARRIEMTPQEVAIALSHIELWKRVADSNIPYTLILEDDAYFRRGFSRSLDKIWCAIMHQRSKGCAFDLLYLSFQEVDADSSTQKQQARLVRKPDRGIWQASGYVLSQTGAKKLIELLPAYGPIDLWLNLQFGKLDVLIAQHPIIEQRVDTPSTNSYSVMPVLSQIGVHTREKPLVARKQKLSGPIFACGEPGSGLTALARALSMLGYTCCSDITEMPAQEQDKLLIKRHDRNFNVYVNIGSLSYQLLNEVAKIYSNARFIFTTHDNSQLSPIIRNRALYLPHEQRDKWAALSVFLEREYPAFPYPICDDIGQRGIITISDQSKNILPFKHLKFDSSPWIVSSKKWEGISLAETEQGGDFKLKVIRAWTVNGVIDNKHWKLRDDTFPSNLALFMPDNIEVSDSGILNLNLRMQYTPVRPFSSAAIVTRQTYLYGSFSAEIQPSNVPGLITGVFLHRNSPYQEIDIEFLGKDTTKMLINVFYNPGIEGTKLEYGYRGSPTQIDLGFDAAEEFHEYEIEWHAYVIRWRVDGRIVHERVLWNPTPIPNLPMELNVNLWHSRSKELAGKLEISRIPAHTSVKSIRITQKKYIVTPKIIK